jgi:hypothetical protein
VTINSSRCFEGGDGLVEYARWAMDGSTIEQRQYRSWIEFHRFVEVGRRLVEFAIAAIDVGSVTIGQREDL